MGVTRFEDLIAWQKAMDLAVRVYDISDAPPFARDFALVQQIHRAAISVPSNIAEGFERDMRKEFRRYLSIAKGSCAEVMTQTYLAQRIGYIDDQTAANVLAHAQQVSRIVGKLRQSLTNARQPTRHSAPGTRHP